MSEQDCLSDVRGWMSFLGWEDGGNPESVKRDAAGNVIARHGDAEWVADCDTAIGHIERERARAMAEELGRRWS